MAQNILAFIVGDYITCAAYGVELHVLTAWSRALHVQKLIAGNYYAPAGCVVDIYAAAHIGNVVIVNGNIITVIQVYPRIRRIAKAVAGDVHIITIA